jgi:formylmethanofuran dehydrogenase subunit E
MPKGKNFRCSECGNFRSGSEIFVVDNSSVCRRCLFGDVPPVKIYPIGFVSNKQERDNSDFGLRGNAGISRIDLFPSQKRFMYKLQEEDRLTIVYYLHKARRVRSRFRRGLDGKQVGVFASRTPDRLSRIGIQDVRLLRINGTALSVEGLDAIDGTPVLDIKMCWHGR